MTDGDNGNNESAVVNLIDGTVVADADAPGIAASELLTAGWTGILLRF